MTDRNPPAGVRSYFQEASYWLARWRDDHQDVLSHSGFLICAAEPKSTPPLTMTLVFLIPAFCTSA